MVLGIVKDSSKIGIGIATPQPKRSKVFELQQSNQGYGELKGVEEVQKNAKQKYSTELIWRTVTLKSLKSMTIWRYLTSYIETES